MGKVAKNDKKSAEQEKSEKHDRSRKLNAERQRRFKEKMTDEQLELKRIRDRQRYYKRKAAKEIKPISEMKARDQIEQRKLWRKRSQAYRERKKAAKAAIHDNSSASNIDVKEEAGVMSKIHIFQGKCLLDVQGCRRKTLCRGNDEERLKEAVKEFLIEDSSVSALAEKYNIPLSTLQDKLTGKNWHPKKYGRVGKGLTREEELALANWIEVRSKNKTPVSRDSFLDKVKSILDDPEVNIPNEFKNNRPGVVWFNCFLKRYPELKSCFNS